MNKQQAAKDFADNYKLLPKRSFDEDLIKSFLAGYDCKEKEAGMNEDMVKQIRDWINIHNTTGECRIDLFEKILVSRSIAQPDSRLREALEKIAHPIKYLRDVAEKEGNQLNGQYTIQLSNDANWLKSIATEALNLK